MESSEAPIIPNPINAMTIESWPTPGTKAENKPPKPIIIPRTMLAKENLSTISTIALFPAANDLINQTVFFCLLGVKKMIAVAVDSNLF